MLLRELELEIPGVHSHQGLLGHFASRIQSATAGRAVPVRFAVTETTSSRYHCEVGLLEQADAYARLDSIFRFVPRPQASERFNAVLVVPTGIGAEIGGHAGDAAPVAKLLAELCDTLVTHPNVVNASDINELPADALYVEGSVLSRFLLGTIGLRPARSNRVLVVIDAHRDPFFVHASMNAVNAARAAFGLRCPRVVQLDAPFALRARYATSGRAVGRVVGLEHLMNVLVDCRDEYDAVALSSVIDVPDEYHTAYFENAGTMVNPWGGVEAILTHAVSSLLDVPSAHSPMFETQAIANMDPGIVDSRMAAEAVSLTFMQCILKGLHRCPGIVTDDPGIQHPDVLTAADVSCVVIPDGCLGLPTLAALEQGLPVIAVRENNNLMKNDLAALPWAPGQFHQAENYWEAAGVMASLKAGISPESVRRPLEQVPISHAGPEANLEDTPTRTELET